MVPFSTVLILSVFLLISEAQTLVIAEVPLASRILVTGVHAVEIAVVSGHMDVVAVT